MATDNGSSEKEGTSTGFTPWQAEGAGDGEMTLSDFYKVIIHQKIWFAGVTAAILIVGFIIISMMPKIYVSKSSILLEREGLYSGRGSTGSQDVLTLRMHGIIKTILSTDAVAEILEKHNMIDENTPRGQLKGKIAAFRNAANFDFDNVSVLREASGKEGLYSMGLTVSYESQSAEQSYEMARELTDRLLGNNAGKMSTENQIRMNYLEERFNLVRAERDAADAELTAFKEENALSLPSMQSIAVRRIDDLGYRILQSEDRLKVLLSRADEAEAQLATMAIDSSVYGTDGKRIASVDDQLTILKLEYASTKDKYSPNHPDRLAMEEKIASLEALAGSGGSEGKQAELNSAREQLSTLRKKYSDQHPDVAALEEKVKFLSEQVRSQGSSSRQRSAASNNPLYNNARARLSGIRTEVTLERNAKENLREELLDVEKRIQMMPAVEAQVRRLNGARDVIEKRYKELEAEIIELGTSSGMREAELFERFVLLEAPDIPLRPAKPNKGVLIPVLVVLAFGIAYLIVFIRHFVRARILSSEDVESVTSLPIYLIPDFKSQ